MEAEIKTFYKLCDWLQYLVNRDKLKNVHIHDNYISIEFYYLEKSCGWLNNLEFSNDGSISDAYHCIMEGVSFQKMQKLIEVILSPNN